MDNRDIRIFSSNALIADHEIYSTRRGLLLAPLLAALPLALSQTEALAGKINPSETQVTMPDAIKWSGWINGFPPRSGEMATLYGGLDRPGPYLVLMKWYPGYMSAPSQLRDGSPLALGEQRRRLRSGQHGSGSRGGIRQARRADPAL